MIWNFDFVYCLLAIYIYIYTYISTLLIAILYLHTACALLLAHMCPNEYTSEHFHRTITNCICFGDLFTTACAPTSEKYVSGQTLGREFSQ